MRWLLPVLIAGAIIAGCGSHRTNTTTVTCPPPAKIGCAVPHTRGIPQVPTAGQTFPDISEYQGCPSFHGPVIFKVYEGGYGQDHSARCNANRVHRLGTWAGVYAFLRPRDCAGQARATVAIVRALGGVSGPVVADAEVYLPPGCVSTFLAVVRGSLGGPVDVYTAPGTWPGGTVSAPLWVATYGPRPGCVAGICTHVAWQYSDAGWCGGLRGDCSVSTGILSQTRYPPKPKPKPNPWPRVAYLRGLAKRHGCYRRDRPKVHACAVWRIEVQHLIHGT